MAFSNLPAGHGWDFSVAASAEEPMEEPIVGQIPAGQRGALEVEIMENVVTLEEILDLTKRLSLVDKVRLIEHLAPQIERGLKATGPIGRKSLRGLWKGLDLTEEDLAEARREMWGNFPREDL